MEVFIKQYYDNKKKVYFLTSDGLLDPLGQSQIIPYLHGLSKKYKIKIISFEKKNNIENINIIKANRLKGFTFNLSFIIWS